MLRIIKGIIGIIFMAFGLALIVLPWVIPPMDGAAAIGGLIFGVIFAFGGLMIFVDGAIYGKRVF